MISEGCLKTGIGMSVAGATATVLMMASLLGGCDQVKHQAGKLVHGGKPTGQVAATVNGEEITTSDLRAELSGVQARDANQLKVLQQAALQQMITRVLLAQKAQELKLDKGAAYNLQLRRGKQQLLAQLYENKLASAIPAPTTQDAEAYVAAHPTMFAQRKTIVVDQIVAGPNSIPVDNWKPVKTMEEAKSLLDSQSVPYQEGVATIDTLTADPRFVAQLDQLPSGEIFVIPQNGGYLINRIITQQASPLEGEAATRVATELLHRQRVQTQVSKQLANLRKSAEDKIVYNDAYRPPATPKPAAPAPAAPARAPT